MRTAVPSHFCLLALAVVGRVVGHNVTIEDPGETIALSLPPRDCGCPSGRASGHADMELMRLRLQSQ